jgi:hypothetical protein
VTTIGGLPAHILLVHAVVVLVPLAALLLVLVTTWPAARARLTLATAVVALAALVSVPLATSAGEWLERRVPRTDLLRTHTSQGDFVVPWAIGLAVVALAVLAREWHAARARERVGAAVGGGAAGEGGSGGGGVALDDSRVADRRWGERPVSVGLAVVAVILAVGSVLTVYTIGDSGARAAWEGKFSAQP